ncbi:MAG: bifunctional precorrin-2 dehydrogenase/sirohydrochlorin ferrochelatase [Haloarculaceae archaeon]
MIPLLHEFAGATVLVFGGGPVGARKARRFAREARVIVVSPAFADAEFGDAELVRAAPAPGDAATWVDRAAPALVVAATDDPALNDAAAAAARDRGALYNRADRSDADGAGRVVVPATVREDPVVVAVATGGTSPALSRYLRERLSDELAGAGEMATLLGDLRDDLSAWPAERRHEALRRVVRDERVWKALGDGGANARQLATDIASAAGDSE